jgi:hypothetical protein
MTVELDGNHDQRKSVTRFFVSLFTYGPNLSIEEIAIIPPDLFLPRLARN